MGNKGSRYVISYHEVLSSFLLDATTLLIIVSGQLSGKNIFQLERLLIPVNFDNIHWMLIVVNFKERKVVLHDTMPVFCAYQRFQYLFMIKRYLADEYESIYHGQLVKGEWNVMIDSNTPRQHLNTNDCCIFVCFFMDFILLDWPIYTLTQECIEHHGRTWLFIAMVWKKIFHESFLYEE
jgi:Ulp1 family protease